MERSNDEQAALDSPADEVEMDLGSLPVEILTHIIFMGGENSFMLFYRLGNINVNTALHIAVERTYKNSYYNLYEDTSSRKLQDEMINIFGNDIQSVKANYIELFDPDRWLIRLLNRLRSLKRLALNQCNNSCVMLVLEGLNTKHRLTVLKIKNSSFRKFALLEYVSEHFWCLKELHLLGSSRPENFATMHTMTNLETLGLQISDHNNLPKVIEKGPNLKKLMLTISNNSPLYGLGSGSIQKLNELLVKRNELKFGIYRVNDPTISIEYANVAALQSIQNLVELRLDVVTKNLDKFLLEIIREISQVEKFYITVPARQLLFFINDNFHENFLAAVQDRNVQLTIEVLCNKVDDKITKKTVTVCNSGISWRNLNVNINWLRLTEIVSRTDPIDTRMMHRVMKYMDRYDQATLCITCPVFRQSVTQIIREKYFDQQKWFIIGEGANYDYTNTFQVFGPHIINLRIFFQNQSTNLYQVINDYCENLVELELCFLHGNTIWNCESFKFPNLRFLQCRAIDTIGLNLLTWSLEFLENIETLAFYGHIRFCSFQADRCQSLRNLTLLKFDRQNANTDAFIEFLQTEIENTTCEIVYVDQNTLGDLADLYTYYLSLQKRDPLDL